MSQLRDFFLARYYPANVVDHAHGQISSLSQEQALQSSEKSSSKNLIPFVVEYNPSLPNIGLIINKYWDLCNSHRKVVLSMCTSISLFWLLKDQKFA